MAGSPMSPDHITAKIEEAGNEVEVLVALRDAKYCEHKKGSDFYMLRNDMGADLAMVFMKWFGSYDTFAAPSQLALGVLYSKDLWLHVEFLTLMQALEGLHRATTPTSKEKITLRSRLDALAMRFPLALRQNILGSASGLVPQSWIHTRNYYTHWNEAYRKSMLDGVGMHRAGVRMKHFLRALYLDMAGIPHPSIIKSLGNACSESQYLIQLNGIEHRRNNPGSQSGAIMHISVSDAGNSDELAS
jgi:hypothetical protein